MYLYGNVQFPGEKDHLISPHGVAIDRVLCMNKKFIIKDCLNHQSESNAHVVSYVILQNSDNLISGKSYCFEVMISHMKLSSDLYLKKP